MADATEADEEATTVEFISASEDAKLRLDCFISITAACGQGDFQVQLECAKRLYDWVMELGTDEAEEEPAAIAPEDQCERRH